MGDVLAVQLLITVRNLDVLGTFLSPRTKQRNASGIVLASFYYGYLGLTLLISLVVAGFFNSSDIPTAYTVILTLKWLLFIVLLWVFTLAETGAREGLDSSLDVRSERIRLIREVDEVVSMVRGVKSTPELASALRATITNLEQYCLKARGWASARGVVGAQEEQSALLIASIRAKAKILTGLSDQAEAQKVITETDQAIEELLRTIR